MEVPSLIEESKKKTSVKKKDRKRKRNGTETNGSGEGKVKKSKERNFTRYIALVFKNMTTGDQEGKLVPKKKNARFSLSSSFVKEVHNLCEQYLRKVNEEWKVYSAKNNKNLVSEKEMNEIIASLWGPHHPRSNAPATWQLNERVQRAVTTYRNCKAPSGTKKLTSMSATGESTEVEQEEAED
jgi:hypothetical protein